MKTFFKAAILSFILVSCFRGKKDLETHLIPDGFNGLVYIIYDRVDGAPIYYEKERRAYQIPLSGILKTQFGPNSGGFSKGEMRFFFVDENGKKKKELKMLTSFDVHNGWYKKYPESFNEDSIMVYNLTFVSAQSFYDSLLQKQIYLPTGYTAYVVDTFKNKDVYRSCFFENLYGKLDRPETGNKE